MKNTHTEEKDRYRATKNKTFLFSWMMEKKSDGVSESRNPSRATTFAFTEWGGLGTLAPTPYGFLWVSFSLRYTLRFFLLLVWSTVFFFFFFVSLKEKGIKQTRKFEPRLKNVCLIYEHLNGHPKKGFFLSPIFFFVDFSLFWLNS